jgi:hypothetical protein
MARLLSIKMRQLLHSKRDKLVFLLSFMLIIVIVISVLNRIASTRNVWHFDCHADSYFSHQGELPLATDKSDLSLMLNIDHHQVQLTYQQQYSPHDNESVQLLGNVNHVDIGSFTYHLALTLPSTRWQDNSRLRRYLVNEFGLLDQDLMADINLSQQIQIVDFGGKTTIATVKFIPSNNLWSCLLIPPNTAQ